ncbi:clotting factor G beta subunit-like [Daktulosphaira vitifoliae]|uniref:clotting factor G beta subunit-like n=1 Tax=Daktulosphaira vitifoliae TaxID=58002 RepID=UPI0021AA7BE6|nr:clotting factor G beta subunit-like [Daktulosphaira vitifoliae]
MLLNCFKVCLLLFYIEYASHIILESFGQILELDEGDVCKRTLDNSQPHHICRHLKDCVAVHESLKKRNYPRICSFVGFEPIVCCPSYNKVTPTTSKITLTPSKSGTSQYAAKMCNEYKKLPFDFLSLGFHEVNKNQNKNLNEAYYKEFPHMALIGYGDSENSITWDCGGSLISNRWILSSAQCNKSGKSANFARWVLLGLINTDWIDDKDRQANLYEIEKRVLHKNYRPTSMYYDIALFRLNREVEFSENIRPICLNSDHLFNPTEVIATEWDQNVTVYSNNKKQTKILQKSMLSTISENECNAVYSTGVNKQYGIQISGDSQICTKYVEDTCVLDTGGPLQVKNPGGEFTTYTQIGIISFGKSCGYPGVPSVYTKVSAFISWIEENVWK